MRRIETTTVFRRDFKREKRGRYRSDLDCFFPEIVSLLAEDARFRNAIATTLLAAIGAITASAISNQTYY
jgi:hypothetical protein